MGTESTGTNFSMSLKKLINLGTQTRNIDIFTSKIKERTQNEEIIALMQDYYLLLTNTNFLRDEMYDFYVLNLSYKEIATKYAIGINTIRTIIYRESKRVQEVSGGYNLYQMWLTNTFTVVNVGIIQVILKTIVDDESLVYKEVHVPKVESNPVAQEKVETSTFLDSKLSVIPSSIVMERKYNTEVSEKNFEQIMSIIIALSKKNQQKLVDKYDVRMWGYMEYLHTIPDASLTARDRERKQKLMQVLNKL